MRLTLSNTKIDLLAYIKALKRLRLISTQANALSYNSKYLMEKLLMKHYFRFLLILVFVAAIGCSKPLSYTFEIPKEELQKKLEEKFPLNPGSQDKEKSPLDMTISNPVVILEEGKNQIGLQVNIVAEPSAPAEKPSPLPTPSAKLPAPLPKKGPGPGPGLLKNAPSLPSDAPKPKIAAPPIPKPRFTGTATVFASIAYNPNDKTIHLSNPKITNLQIAQLPDQLSKPLSEMAEKTLGEKFAEKPIPLESKTTLDKAVTTFLKSVTVKNGKLLVEIGW